MVKTPRPDQPMEPKEVHLLDYWRIVWRGRWTVAALFVVIVTVVTIGTYLQDPVYQAGATVEIQARANKVLPFYQDVSPIGVGSWGWYGEQRYFNTQYEIIKSQDVAERVVQKLDLRNHPRFQGSDDPAGILARMVRVEPVEETGIVQILMTGRNPKEITLWVNTVAEAYVERNLEIAVRSTREALDQLLQEIDPMLDAVRQSEKKRLAFMKGENIYVPEDRQEQIQKQLSRLQEDLTGTRTRRLDLEAVFRKIEEVEKRGGDYKVIPQVASDPVIVRLNERRSDLERELNRLQVQYLPKHAKVVEKKAELEKVVSNIKSEMEKIVDTVKTEYSLLVEKEKQLERRIRQGEEESLEINRRVLEYEVLKSESAEKKRLYDLITSRRNEINLNQALLSNNIRILDYAIEPKAPIRPRKALNILVGVILGLMVGIGTVFFLDYMDNTVKTSDDVEQYLRLHLLSVVPRFREGFHRPVKEAFQTLRTSMLFSRRNRDHNTVLVTSAAPREGKTSTVVNLGKTLASGGESVVILDADLRRPSIHDQLKLDRSSGLTNFLLSTDGDDWRNYLKVTSTPNLHALTCGPIPPNPPELFGTERFVSLIQHLRENFNWVLIDSPPVISLTDSVILASLVDMVTFVIRHSENDKEMIRRCVNNIRNVNSNVIGAVLNDVDLARSHYRDYYYAGYYYYGAGERKEKKRKKVRATA